MNLRNNIFVGTLGINKVDEIRAALRAGYRNFDCATVYKQCLPCLKDALLAEGIKREEVTICVKFNDEDLINNEFSVRKILDKVLNNLGTDYLDIFMMHSPACIWHNKAVQVFNELEVLKAEEIIKDIGVSNFLLSDLKRLNDSYLKLISYNSIEMSPYGQQKETVEFCDNHNMTVMPYRILTKGKAPDLFENETIRRIASNHQESLQQKVSPQQVIVAWAMQNKHKAIVKAVNPEHLEANMKACDIMLSKNEMDAISALDKNYYNANDWPKFIKLADYEDYKTGKKRTGVTPETPRRLGLYDKNATVLPERVAVQNTNTSTIKP